MSNSRKQSRHWRDKYTSTKSRYSRWDDRRDDIEPPHKKHKSSTYEPNTNNTNSNVFIKPTSNLTFLERETNGDNTKSGIITYNKNHNKRMDIQRRTLPIYKYRDKILHSVETYRTTIIVGETGSGKTTQIPQYLHESGWTTNTRMICCTQPRRISTVSIANRVAKEMNDKIGNITGYAIRFDSKLSVNTRIKFLTDGMLLSELLIDPLLSQYSVIILDEAHERSINIDLLLGLMKKILNIRLDIRLIVSSATLDAIKFKNFFTFSNDNKTDANILCVEGRTYPVELFYLDESCRNYVSQAVDTVINIHITKPMGDILVFLTGESEIMEACQLCENKVANLANKYRNNVLILPMYAGLNFNNQLKVFRKTNFQIRKIIFATNIAETSITIDGIVYVIDSGFVKLPSFDPLSGVSSLFVSSISKACCNQRKGRAGRIGNGECYRLFSENIYNSKLLNEYNIPEIQRSDLTECILKLKSLGIDNILNFEFISPPPIIAVTYALELLYALNVINDNCKLTQPFGKIISELPCDPRMGVMLVESGQLKCSQEILSIAAMLQIKNIWKNTMTKLQRTKQNDMKLKFAVLEGDHLTYLNIFNSFILNNKSGNWCKENYLEYKSLKRATEIRQLLKKYLKYFKIPLVSCKEDAISVLKCIVKGYFSNAAQIQSNGSYKTIRGNQILYMHKSSIIYSEAIPWVVFHEIQQTDYVYMHDVCAVKPTWLQQLASHFYQYKKLSHQTHDDHDDDGLDNKQNKKISKKKRQKQKTLNK